MYIIDELLELIIPVIDPYQMDARFFALEFMKVWVFGNILPNKNKASIVI